MSLSEEPFKFLEKEGKHTKKNKENRTTNKTRASKKARIGRSQKLPRDNGETIFLARAFEMARTALRAGGSLSRKQEHLESWGEAFLLTVGAFTACG